MKIKFSEETNKIDVARFCKQLFLLFKQFLLPPSQERSDFSSSQLQKMSNFHNYIRFQKFPNQNVFQDILNNWFLEPFAPPRTPPPPPQKKIKTNLAEFGFYTSQGTKSRKKPMV